MSEMTKDLQVPEATTAFDELAVAEGVVAALVGLTPDARRKLYEYASIKGFVSTGTDLVEVSLKHLIVPRAP